MLAFILVIVPIVLISLFLYIIFPNQIQQARTYVKSLKTGELVPSTLPMTPLTDVIGIQSVERHLALQKKYHKVGLFQECFLYAWWVNLWDSSVIAPLFYRGDENYGRDLSMLGVLNEFFGTSVIGVSGEKWKRQHRILSKAFTPTNINRFLPLMVEGLKTRVVPQIDQLMKEKGKVDMNDILQGLAIDYIIQAGFATDPKETKELRELFNICREGFEDPLFTLPGYKYLTFIPQVKKVTTALKRIDALAMSLIQKRRKYLLQEKEKTSDENESLQVKYIIDLLLEARDDGDNAQLNDQELKDNVLLFFLAGSETTAISMLWFVHNVLVHDSQVYHRLQEEVDKVLPNDPNNLSLQDISNLTYFNHVLHESMRLTPSVPISGMRIFKEDTQVGDWSFKKGSWMLMNILLSHRNPDNYENPDVFDPDRWDISKRTNKETGVVSKFKEITTEESDDTKDTKDLVQLWSQAGKYGPFGCGRRVCLGKSFAYLEMRVVLTYLLKKYKFSLPKDETFPKKEAIRLPTMYPLDGVRVVLEPR